MKKFLFYVSVLLCFAFSLPEDKNLSEVKVNVKGIKTVEGNLAILVFNNKDGFPESKNKAVKEMVVKVTSTEMQVNLGKLPQGSYAIALIHDANSNNVLDKNVLGIPKEQFGFTNTEKVYFGPPGFEDASFELKGTPETVEVKLLFI